MINNSSLQKWQRLQQKQLDEVFKRHIQKGLNCSPFESEAILESVHLIYGNYFDNSASIKPGQIITQVVSVEEGAQSRLSECKLVNVVLTLNGGSADLSIRSKPNGHQLLRQHRLERICVEAFQQGGLLVLEDIAYSLFNCGMRTLTRDLQALRQQGIHLPLRSTIKDMGRSLSHRTQIIQLWLKGLEYTEVAQQSYHSIRAVRNYVDKFKRCIMLFLADVSEVHISMLVKLSIQLVKQYCHLWTISTKTSQRIKELEQFCTKKNLFNTKINNLL